MNNKELKFRAIIPERNATIYFTLSELLVNKFSNREILWKWLRDGNEPDRYTGFTDSKGKEIYEGDIMPLWTIPDKEEDYEAGKNQLRHVAVEWSNGMYNICESHWCTFVPQYAIVIGNKYENPELIERN